jgi:hypothetical protein
VKRKKKKKKKFLSEKKSCQGQAAGRERFTVSILGRFAQQRMRIGMAVHHGGERTR